MISKINPFFQKILRLSVRSPGTAKTLQQLVSPTPYRRRTAVKSGFSAQMRPCGKNHRVQKSGKFDELRRTLLCEPNLHIHTSRSLWKTPVENTVDNVENCELSTGISLFSPAPLSCGKVCIDLCIFLPEIRKSTCYVTKVSTGFSGKIKVKSLQIVKFRAHILFPFDTVRKFFVKNAKTTMPVSTGNCGEYLKQAGCSLPVIHNIRGYTCREK